jgi:hypothetical protein
MIQCPSCQKDIADDSAHCGFCGAKIETGAGKKTMIGFAALTGDALKQAAEEARQAREAAADSKPTVSQQAPTAPQSAPPTLPELPSRALPKPAPGHLNDYTTPTAGTPAAVSLGSDAQPETEASKATTRALETPEVFDTPTTDRVPAPATITAPEISVGAEASQSGAMAVPENTLPEKKRSPAIYVVGAVVALFALCCVLGLVWSFIVPML